MTSWTSWPATPGTGWYGWNWGCSPPMTRPWRASTGATTRPASAEAAVRAAARGLAVVAHVILGLPGEGPREMAATAEFLARLPVHGVKIHLLYVVKDSGLARLHEQGEYVCLTEDQYVSGVVDFIERLPPHLVIHRLTSDPHAEELVAPAWCLDKPRVMQAYPGGIPAPGDSPGESSHHVSLLSGYLISRGRKE